MQIFDPMRAIFDMLIKRINEATTREHPEVAGLCRALAVIADPGAVDENDLTEKLRAIGRQTFDDLVEGAGVLNGTFTRDMFLAHAETRGLGSMLGRFASPPARQTGTG